MAEKYVTVHNKGVSNSARCLQFLCIQCCRSQQGGILLLSECHNITAVDCKTGYGRLVLTCCLHCNLYPTTLKGCSIGVAQALLLGLFVHTVSHQPFNG